MDDQGNILIKRVSKCNVYVKNTSNNGEESSVGNEVLKLNNCALEMDKPVKVLSPFLIIYLDYLDRNRLYSHIYKINPLIQSISIGVTAVWGYVWCFKSQKLFAFKPNFFEYNSHICKIRSDQGVKYLYQYVWFIKIDLTYTECESIYR